MFPRATFVVVVTLLNCCVQKDYSDKAIIESSRSILLFEQVSEDSFRSKEVFQTFQNAVAEAKQLDFESARTFLEKALQSDPKNKIIHASLGVTELNLGNYESGIDLLKKAYQLDSTYLIAYVNIAPAHNAQKQYEQAIEVCDFVMRKSTSRTALCAANYNKAIAKHELGFLEDAILYMKQAIEFTDNEDVAKRLQEAKDAWEAERDLKNTLNVEH